MTNKVLSFVTILLAKHAYCQSVTNSANIKGVIPTASGQIGVNPVTDLGPNTQWYQPDGSTTKWIGKNTEYLTDLPYTTTINNQPTVTQVPAAIVAVTATASAHGIEPGDVSIALSPKVFDIFNKLFDEALAACGGQQKRDLCPLKTFAQRLIKEASPGGLFDFILAATRILFPTVASSEVEAIVGPLVIVLSPVVTLGVTWGLMGRLQAWTISSAYIVPAGRGGEKDRQCPADAPKGVDAPLCVDTDCKGDNSKPNQKCTEGKYKGCECLTTGQIADVLDTDMAKYDDGLIWLDLQQKVLQDFVDQSSKGPYCYHGASPRGPRIPKEYCNCGDDSRKTLTYSVASSTASPYNACPYTTNNGPIVTFQPESTAAPAATPVVKCSGPRERWLSTSDGIYLTGQFCKGERYMHLRSPGGGFKEASWLERNSMKDPILRVHAYLDDGCKDKKPMKMNLEDCAKALHAIIHDCDKDTDKKMVGSAVINCQWFNIEAVKGPSRWPMCDGIPSEKGC